MKTIPLFNNFLKTGSNDFVAINLGSHYLKGLVIKGNRITDFFLKERKDLSTALKEIWQEKKISSDRIKLSVKDPSTMVRYFSFPRLEKKKLRQTLFYELNKHIPFAPQDVYFDFSILKEISPSQVYIVLAVAKKDFIDNITQAFEKEKLKILDISLDSISLINVFLASGVDKLKNVCILDARASFSTLSLLAKDMPILTRDLNFNMKEILSTLSHVRQIPMSEIDKWLVSNEPQNETLKLIEDNITSLCKELKSSFDYFEVNKAEHIEKLYITGGISYLKGVESIFKDFLDIEVEYLGMPQKLIIDFKEGNFRAIEKSFTVAFGLVL